MKDYKYLIVALILGLGVTLWGASAQYNISQGITVRNDGSVIIDSWKSFDNSTNPTLQGSEGRTTILPNSITLGKSLGDSTKICIEDELGCKFVTLRSIRVTTPSIK